MREVAAFYQELVGEQKNIAICMAGLPHTVSAVLNDKVLTFLNRADKVLLGAISTEAIRAYYDRIFHAMNIRISSKQLDQAAHMTKGLPYLMQLVGYYLTIYARDGKNVTSQILEKAQKAAVQDMNDNVFLCLLAPLSDNDRIFFRAMADCSEPVTTSQLKAKLGSGKAALQP